MNIYIFPYLSAFSNVLVQTLGSSRIQLKNKNHFTIHIFGNSTNIIKVPFIHKIQLIITCLVYAIMKFS